MVTLTLVVWNIYQNVKQETITENGRGLKLVKY